MALRKIDHVRKAYERLVISNITTSPSPDEIKIALERLEDMLNEFYGRNICSDWLFEDEPLPNTESGLDPQFNYAVETNLARRLCDLFGKPVTPELEKSSTQSLSNWSARSSKTNEILPPRRQPRGSGQTFRWDNWLRYFRFVNNAPIECDTFEIKENAEDFFTVDFGNFLIAGATITNYEVDTSAANGLEVLEHSLSGDQITLKVRGTNFGYNQVILNVTTSTGRINPQGVNFNVIDS